MKRFSKVLALCILLAVVLSVFGIFSAFAEDADSGAASYGTFIKEPGGKLSIVGNQGSHPALTSEKDLNGKRYYKLAFDGADPGVGDYLNVAFTVENKTAANGIRVGNHTFSDGSTVEKNTDYLVVDFDLSTDTTYIDGLYFHTAFYDADYTHADRYQPSVKNVKAANSMYFALMGTDNETMQIGEDASSTIHASAPFGADVWQHVTFVYDFRDTSNVSVYFYINGVHSGSKTKINISPALALYFFRISTQKQTLEDASTNIANFSVKRFDIGYNGPMVSDGLLGKIGTTLDQIPDLAYCLEDAPVTEQTKLADVTRADGTGFTAYKASELNVALSNGDTVTLYKNLDSAVIVPKGADITWELNGHLEPKLVEVNYGLTDAVITNYITGELIAEVPTGGLIDTIREYKDKNIRVTFFRDITAVVTNSLTVNRHCTLDLNGHKLTFTGAKHVFQPQSGSIVRITGGSLEVDVASANNLSMTNYQAYFSIENMEKVTSIQAMLFDQRGGITRFENCESIEVARTIASTKSGGRSGSKLELINSNISVAAGDAISVSNTSQSKVGRYGSLNVTVIIDNSTVNAPGRLVNVEVYANASGTKEGSAYTETTNEQNLKNDNDFALVVNNSKVNVGGDLVYGGLMALTNVNNGNPANGLTLDLGIDVTDSKIAAAHFLCQSGDRTGVDYKYCAYINVAATDLDLTADTLVNKENNTAKATVEMNISGESNLTTNKLVAVGGVGAQLNVASPYTLINRSHSDEHNYTYIVTENCATHPIIINGEETEMQWYAGDAITPSDLPDDLLPPPNKYVSYEWVYNDDGAFEAVRTGDIPVLANLGLGESMTFKVYIPADLDPTTYDTVTVNGKAAELKDVNIEGEAYKLIELSDVNPADADEKISLQLVIYIGGVRVEKITKRLSVLDYAAAILKDESANAEDKALVASVVNYIDAAQAYVGKTSAATDAIVASDAYKNALPEIAGDPAINTVSALGVFDRVYLTLDSSFAYKFVTKSSFVGTVSVSYIKDGVEVVDTYEVDGMELITVRLDASDLLGAVKVTVGGATGEYTVASYLDSVSAAHPEATALGNAIELYAAMAKAYAN